jgi:hypothetical protein
MPDSMAFPAPGQSVPDNSQAELPRLATGVVIALCAVKLGLHLLTGVRHYGYFRDELYYLDMARHLDWGYVDAPPLVAVYAKVALALGGSLAALRILPALAGTALVLLSVLIARELGGGRYAQLLTGLSLLFAPGWLVSDSLMTMNAFEPLFWMGCALVVARIVRTGDSRLWLWFGVLAGLGLENKHSALFFGFAVTVALLLTRQRRELLKPSIWIAGGIVLALFLPNLIWQIRHHFPTLQDLENVRREGKNVVLGPLAFVTKPKIGETAPTWRHLLRVGQEATISSPDRVPAVSTMGFRPRSIDVRVVQIAQLGCQMHSKRHSFLQTKHPDLALTILGSAQTGVLNLPWEIHAVDDVLVARV